jgi:hypothetical protein
MNYVPVRMEQNGMRFHHAHHCAQFKTNELFISGIFHLIFSDWLTETAERETTDKGRVLYC